MIQYKPRGLNLFAILWFTLFVVENGKTEQILRGRQMSSFSTRKTKTGKRTDSDGDWDEGERLSHGDVEVDDQDA